MDRIDGPSAALDRLFTEGSPTGGVPATVVTDSWLNDVQEELIHVIEAAGITPQKGVRTQILEAIRKVGAKFSTQSEVNAGVSTDTVISPATVRFGFQFQASSNGYIVFPTFLGGFVIQWGAVSTSFSSTVEVALPIPFPNLGFGAVCSAIDSSAALFAEGNIQGLSSIRASAFDFNGNRSVTTVRYIAFGK